MVSEARVTTTIPPMIIWRLPPFPTSASRSRRTGHPGWGTASVRTGPPPPPRSRGDVLPAGHFTFDRLGRSASRRARVASHERRMSLGLCHRIVISMGVTRMRQLVHITLGVHRLEQRAIARGIPGQGVDPGTAMAIYGLHGCRRAQNDLPLRRNVPQHKNDDRRHHSSTNQPRASKASAMKTRNGTPGNHQMLVHMVLRRQVRTGHDRWDIGPLSAD